MRRRSCKHDLDGMVSRELGLPLKEVREITTSFLSAIRIKLVNLNVVELENLGKLTPAVSKKVRVRPLHVRTGPVPKGTKLGKPDTQYQIQRTTWVHFSKATLFNRMLREKYGPNGKRVRIEP